MVDNSAVDFVTVKKMKKSLQKVKKRLDRLYIVLYIIARRQEEQLNQTRRCSMYLNRESINAINTLKARIHHKDNSQESVGFRASHTPRGAAVVRGRGNDMA